MKLLPISGLKYTVTDKTGWSVKGVETFPINRADAIKDNLISTDAGDTNERFLARYGSNTGNPHAWVQIKFDDTYTVAEVHITLRRGKLQGSDVMQEFEVWVGVDEVEGSAGIEDGQPSCTTPFTGTAGTTLCKKIRHDDATLDRTNVLIVTCDQPLVGEYLFIQMTDEDPTNNKRLTIEEVDVVFQEAEKSISEF